MALTEFYSQRIQDFCKYQIFNHPTKRFENIWAAHPPLIMQDPPLIFNHPSLTINHPLIINHPVYKDFLNLFLSRTKGPGVMLWTVNPNNWPSIHSVDFPVNLLSKRSRNTLWQAYQKIYGTSPFFDGKILYFCSHVQIFNSYQLEPHKAVAEVSKIGNL